MQEEVFELSLQFSTVLLPSLFTFKVFVVLQIKSLRLNLLKLADDLDLLLTLALQKQRRSFSFFEFLSRLLAALPSATSFFGFGRQG